MDMGLIVGLSVGIVFFLIPFSIWFYKEHWRKST
jgi:hypothetical protein